MTLEDAQARLSTCPSLGKLVKQKWLDEEAAKATEDQSDLYRMLEWDWPGIDGFLEGLERTLNARVSGPYNKIADRLTSSDTSNYRSALDELSFSTRLRDCGYEVTVGSPGRPDILAQQGSRSLLIELTAPLKTRWFYALQGQIARQWKATGHRVVLVPGDKPFVSSPKQDAAIIKEIMAVVAHSPTETVYLDLSSVVDPETLRVEVAPGWTGVVAATSPYRTFDPLPDIEETISKKRTQLLRAGEVVLAINLDRLQLGAHTWSLSKNNDFRYGARSPTIEAPTNVIGVLTFHGGAVPGGVVTMPNWLANSARTEAGPELLQPVLMALGWPGPSIVGRPTDGP
ncbi:MAG: hypothetical protein ABSG37_11980 [Candidatus Limnocylindrales bacterium]|jgi:hypothetical protein